MNKKKLLIFAIIFIVLFVCVLNLNMPIAKADELSENIEEQLQNIDLKELENFFDNIKDKPFGLDFMQCVYEILNGEYNLDYNTLIQYVSKTLINNIFEILPIFISIISISIFCGITQSFKGSFLSDGIADVIFFICFLSVILVLFTEILSLLNNAKIIIENMAKLTEIMSPIILTLMIASGGSVSAKVYQPAVGFLSNGVISIILNLVFPLIGIIVLFNIVSNLSQSIKLNKFSDCAQSIIKWVMGITMTIFGIFITIQGITSASYDGLSIKLAKYTVSNSIPIIGGFIKDGFDFVIAGSILIKNSIGVVSVFALFYTILSPLLYLLIFTTLLKVVGALIEPITDVRISNFCTSMSKCISYVSMSIIMTSFMLFILIVLMIISVNVYI